MKTPNLKLQAIVENKPWPFVGNGYTNANGAISILLDRGVALVLADGTRLEGAVKLYLRASIPRPEAPVDPAA
jgi:hypothetical protein